MKLSLILPKVLQYRGLSEEAYAGLLLENCKQYITIYLGEESEKMVIPTKVMGNKIFVQALSSGWAHLFLLKKNYILSALKNDFPGKKLEMVLKR